MKSKRIAMAVAVLLLALSAGCVAVIGAGVAGIAYVKGEAKKTYAASMDDCINGVENALKALEIKIEGTSGDKLEFIFKGKTAEDTVVEVKVKSIATESTEVSVRFGVFGDKKKSTRVHEEFAKFIKEEKK